MCSVTFFCYSYLGFTEKSLLPLIILKSKAKFYFSQQQSNCGGGIILETFPVS